MKSDALARPGDSFSAGPCFFLSLTFPSAQNFDCVLISHMIDETFNTICEA